MDREYPEVEFYRKICKPHFYDHLADFERTLAARMPEPIRRPVELRLANSDGVKFLSLHCGKCTREVSIMGISREDCNEQAKRAGWGKNGEASICGKCPAVREKYFEEPVELVDPLIILR